MSKKNRTIVSVELYKDYQICLYSTGAAVVRGTSEEHPDNVFRLPGYVKNSENGLNLDEPGMVSLFTISDIAEEFSNGILYHIIDAFDAFCHHNEVKKDHFIDNHFSVNYSSAMDNDLVKEIFSNDSLNDMEKWVLFRSVNATFPRLGREENQKIYRFIMDSQLDFDKLNNMERNLTIKEAESFIMPYFPDSLSLTIKNEDSYKKLCAVMALYAGETKTLGEIKENRVVKLSRSMTEYEKDALVQYSSMNNSKTTFSDMSHRTFVWHMNAPYAVKKLPKDLYSYIFDKLDSFPQTNETENSNNPSEKYYLTDEEFEKFSKDYLELNLAKDQHNTMSEFRWSYNMTMAYLHSHMPEGVIFKDVVDEIVAYMDNNFKSPYRITSYRNSFPVWLNDFVNSSTLRETIIESMETGMPLSIMANINGVSIEPKSYWI